MIKFSANILNFKAIPFILICLFTGNHILAQEAEEIEIESQKHQFCAFAGPAGISIVPQSIFVGIEYLPIEHIALYSTFRYLKFPETNEKDARISHAKYQFGVKYYQNHGPEGIFYKAFLDLYQPSEVSYGAGFGFQFFPKKRFGISTGLDFYKSNRIEPDVSTIKIRLNLAVVFCLKELVDPFQ